MMFNKCQLLFGVTWADTMEQTFTNEQCWIILNPLQVQEMPMAFNGLQHRVFRIWFQIFHHNYSLRKSHLYCNVIIRKIYPNYFQRILNYVFFNWISQLRHEVQCSSWSSTTTVRLNRLKEELWKFSFISSINPDSKIIFSM